MTHPELTVTDAPVVERLQAAIEVGWSSFRAVSCWRYIAATYQLNAIDAAIATQVMAYMYVPIDLCQWAHSVEQQLWAVQQFLGVDRAIVDASWSAFRGKFSRLPVVDVALTFKRVVFERGKLPLVDDSTLTAQELFEFKLEAPNDIP